MFFLSIKSYATDYGDSLYDAGDYYGAIVAYKSQETEGNCKIQSHIGVAYYMLKDFNNATVYFFKTLNCGEKSGDKKTIGFAYNNIGLIYYEQNDYEKAILYFNKSMDNAKELNDIKSIANSLNNIGLINIVLENFEFALECFEQTIVLNLQLDEMESVADAYINLGKTYSALGNKNQAIDYYLKAIEINNLEILSISLGNLASIYFQLGEYQLARKNAKESIELAQKIGDIHLEAVNLKTLSNTYGAMKQYEKAFKYLSLYDSYKDSISRQADVSVLYNLEMKYKTAQMDTEIELLNKNNIISEQKIENQNNIILFTSISVLLFVILSLFIFRSYRKSNRMNSVITESKKEIELKNKDITDSINYANRIQTGMLSKYKVIKDKMNESFILFKPKDIVSGDFYWAEIQNDLTLFSISDCTGHGVPGAFMSFIGHSGLNKIVNEDRVTTPGKVLDQLNTIVADNFTYSEEVVKDGMDMTFCTFNKQTNVLQFAGANNPIYVVRNSSEGTLEGEKVKYSLEGIDLYQIGGDKNYIGGATNKFTTKEFQLKAEDTVYLFTDGYADQFGGPKGKKMLYKRMQKILVENFKLPLETQKERLETALLDWMGNQEQVDDISIMGFKV